MPHFSMYDAEVCSQVTVSLDVVVREVSTSTLAGGNGSINRQMTYFHHMLLLVEHSHAERGHTGTDITVKHECHGSYWAVNGSTRDCLVHVRKKITVADMGTTRLR